MRAVLLYIPMHTLLISTFGVLHVFGAVIGQPHVEPPTFLNQLFRPVVPYTFRPTKVHSTKGSVSNADGLVQSSGPSSRNGTQTVTKLSPNSSIILDFGLNVGGYPLFEFGSGALDHTAAIRYTVSESLAALKPGVGDGYPFMGFAGARSRSEHITGTSDITINEVGFQAATDVTPIPDLPGAFNSSDEYLNELWMAGARTVQLGCTSKGSIAPAWHVSAIGTLIESKNIAVHQKGQAWGQVDFSISIYVISGSIFTVNKGNLFAPEPGPTVFSLVFGPDGAGTFSRYQGSSVDFPSGLLTPGKWHNLKFSVRGDTNASMTLSINEVQIGAVSFDGTPSAGPLGISAGTDTAVIVKNFLVQDIDGNTLYFNSMTSQSALEDFATGTNYYGVCFDGAKRDRVVWAGDFSIFGPTVATNVEAVAGSLLLFTGIQDAQGQISTSILPSAVPSGFQLTNGLVMTSIPSCYTSLNFNYYDGTTPGTHISANSIVVWALRNAALISDAIGDSVASEYREVGDKIEKAVNDRLFSKRTGAYILVDGNDTVGISQDGNSYAILSGIASAPGAPSSASAVIEAMRALDTPFGPLSFSNTSRFLPIVSPYASGFHTWAAFEAGMDDEAIRLMRTVWKNQTDVNNPWYTGMTWEFINGTSGEPYNSQSSSQAHGWASAPTWQLSRYVLGYVNGRVPTPWGTIFASWETTDSGFKMQINAPPGTNGTIVVPGAANKIVNINGISIGPSGNITLPEGVTWAGADGNSYRMNVTNGRSTISISV
ncbi:Glycoside hydrolase family 78 [Rhizoctonia solani]|uniref:Glycoside hydrolase family 78 n=1 Tax=Rhizoctonia solani TaxID=456999 RepID=A0A8H7IDU9_9AGAM|nr:Glycoside hydrolase family 78 [Rhizoctonia solani]